MWRKFLLSILCVSVLTLISGCSLSYTSNDIDKQPLSTIKDETITEHVSSIQFDWLSGNIIFYESEDDSITLIEKATDTFASENTFTTSISDETLYIKDYNKNNLQLSINVNYVLEVYLPQKEYKEINIQVESGDIELSCQNIPERMSIEGTSSDVELTFPSNSGFVLYLDLTSGDLNNVFQTTSKDGITKIYGNGASDISVSLVSGDLTIKQSE